MRKWLSLFLMAKGSPTSCDPRKNVSAGGGKGKRFPFPPPALTFLRGSQLAGLGQGAKFSKKWRIVVFENFDRFRDFQSSLRLRSIRDLIEVFKFRKTKEEVQESLSNVLREIMYVSR